MGAQRACAIWLRLRGLTNSELAYSMRLPSVTLKEPVSICATPADCTEAVDHP